METKTIKTGTNKYVVDSSTTGMFMWQVIGVAAAILICNHYRDRYLQSSTVYWLAIIGGSLFAMWFAYWFYTTIWSQLTAWLTDWIPFLS